MNLIFRGIYKDDFNSLNMNNLYKEFSIEILFLILNLATLNSFKNSMSKDTKNTVQRVKRLSCVDNYNLENVDLEN